MEKINTYFFETIFGTFDILIVWIVQYFKTSNRFSNKKKLWFNIDKSGAIYGAGVKNVSWNWIIPVFHDLKKSLWIIQFHEKKFASGQ